MTANCRSKSTGKLPGRTACALLLVALWAPLAAQTQTPAPIPAPPAGTPAPPVMAAPNGPTVPNDYVIGTDDILQVVFWKDKDMSAEARVRPDGRIALPLINEVQAAGLTPEALQKKITEESRKYMEDASITIVVREINSLKVFITGEIAKPGVYGLTSSMSVMQLLSLAGGLKEYANAKNITIMRNQGGKQVALKFNYREVAAGKKLQQNIELKPGDTVVVP